MDNRPISSLDFSQPYSGLLASFFKMVLFLAPGTLLFAASDMDADLILLAPFASAVFIGLGIFSYWLTVQCNMFLIEPMLQWQWAKNTGNRTSKVVDLVYLALLLPCPMGPDKPAQTFAKRKSDYKYAFEQFDYDWEKHFGQSNRASLLLGSGAGSIAAIVVFAIVLIMGNGQATIDILMVESLFALFGTVFFSSVLATWVQINTNHYWAFSICSVAAFLIMMAVSLPLFGTLLNLILGNLF